MIINQIHSGITVSNLERSIKFYRDILGFKLIKHEQVTKSRGERLGVSGAVIEVVIFEYGNGQLIELIQYIEPAAPNSYGAPVNAIGHVHIAFKVDDIEAQIKSMQEKGVQFVGGNEYETVAHGPLKGLKWIYFKDPDGTNLELIEES